jgi:hypothetical protein
MPHESSRRRIRRELAHKLKEEGNDGPEKRVPSSLEVSGLLQSMITNNIAQFGLVRLSAWDLNGPISSDVLEPPLDKDGPLTLLEHACLMNNRDKFVGALLRARCDATATRDSGKGGDAEVAMRQDAKEVLSRLQPMAAVWTVKKIVEMRVRGREGEDSTPTPPQEAQCQLCQKSKGSRSLLTWSCKHQFACETCLWRNLSQLQDQGICIDSAFACNHCQPIQSQTPQTLSLSSSRQEALRIKIESNERWLGLPFDISHTPPSKQSMGNRPKTFEGKPESEVARLFVGGTKSQRLQKFYDAAIDGNVERIRALIEAGVDVDATNEMGMTALFSSAMYGHLGAVQLLLSAGADLLITSNGGSSCLDAAIAQEHHAVANLIKSELGLEAEPLSPLPCSSVGIEQPLHVSVEVLIPLSSSHPGAGAILIDNGITEAEMCQLESLFYRLGSGSQINTDSSQYYTCEVERRHFCDSEGWVSSILRSILTRARTIEPCSPELSSLGDPLPLMRFLHYSQPLSSMKPHVDLSKKVPDPKGDKEKSKRSSRFTFLLYLSSGPEDGGGETLLLEREAPTLEACGHVLSSVRPKRGRLIAYPHKTPHAGAEVLLPPKTLLRGEFY